MNNSEDNKTIYEILTCALDIAGDISKLSEEINVSVPAIYAWRNGRRTPNRSNIEILHKYIKQNAPAVYSEYIQKRHIISDSMTKETDDFILPNTISPSTTLFSSIPKLDENLEETGEVYAFHQQWLNKVSDNKKNALFIYQYTGINMSPTFFTDSLLLINTRSKILVDGKYYLILLDNIVYLRRVLIIPKKYVFRVDNREFALQDILIEELNTIKIIGEVIWTCKAF